MLLQLEEHVLKGTKLRGLLSFFISFDVKERKKYQNNFSKVAGSRAGKWKCLKWLIPEMDESDFTRISGVFCMLTARGHLI